MRTVVIGDIHGCYNELEQLLLDLESNQVYNKNTDRLIFLGDYIDRGKDSKKVVRFIRSLQRDNENVIALKGNHEDMCVNYYKYGRLDWKINGANKTIKSYHGHKELRRDLNWMEHLPLYYEDEHFIYVHAGIDANKPMSEQSNYHLLWVREPFLWSTTKQDKRVVFGHTPSQLAIESDKPYYTLADNIGIDTGCVFGGKLTALIIDDDKITEFWQTQNGNNN